MAAQNPYQLSAADQAEIRTWAAARGLNQDIQLAEANKLLISGQAASMDDLRRLAGAKTGVTTPTLSAENETEIRNWAAGRDLNPEIQLGAARGILASGVAGSVNDLKSLVQVKDAMNKPAATSVAPPPPGSTELSGPTTYNPITPRSDAVPAAPVTTATAVGYTPVTTTSEGYTPTTYTAEGYTPVTRGAEKYTAEQGTAQTWTVDPSQTVEGRLQGILSKGSPLLTLAETKARQGMAGRGLLNSSMATGEALRAVTETATPIATADAATFAKAAQFNAEQQNLMTQFNVREVNAAAAFNANAANQALADNQRAENAAKEFMAAATNESKAFTAQSANDAAAFTANARNVAAAASAAAENNAKAFQAQAQNAVSLEQARAANAAAVQARADAQRLNEIAIAAENDARRFAADAANRQAEQERLIAADRELAQFNQRAQVSSQATNLFQQTTDNITRIMADPDLEPAAKQAAVDQQKASLDTSLRFLEQVNNVDGLKALLSF